MRARAPLLALAVCAKVQADGYWLVTSGSCSILEEADTYCVTSPNYPNPYTNSASCTIGILPEDWNGYAISVAAFSTEENLDTLTVNGRAYSGTSGPQLITPTTPLTWKTDSGNSRSGWKLCPQPISSFATAAPSTTRFGSTSSSSRMAVVQATNDNSLRTSPLTTTPGVTSSRSGSNRTAVVQASNDYGLPMSSSTTGPASSGGETSSQSSRPVVIGAIVGSIGGFVMLVLVGIVYWRFMWQPQKEADPRFPKMADLSVLPPIPGAAPRKLAPFTVGVESPYLDIDEKEESWIKITRMPIIPPFDERRFPAYWAMSEEIGGFEKVPVNPNELQALQRMVDDTHKQIKTRDRKEGKVPRRLEILGVERIENSELWNKYSIGRFAVKTKRPHKCTPAASYGGSILTERELPPELKDLLQPKVNEVYLWHGTNPTAADSICRGGFRLSFAGTGAGTMYGPGTYFAECSSKSDEYAGEGPTSKGSGVYCLLLCRVVLGELLHLTTGGSETHAMIKAGMESEAYDSVLGDREASVGTYREFVVFQEDQIYPEYKILYRRVLS